MEQRNIGKRNDNLPIPVALTIAGSDSGGGAGVQADLRTFSACGIFGASAITAVTSQNPQKVSRVDALSPEAVRTQIEIVFEALNVRAVKTGMLFSADIIAAVANSLKDKKCPVVVDPVMVSTSRVRLLKDDALEILQSDILPIADWITPNFPEAELLAGFPIQSVQDAVRAAETIAAKWDTCVIVKGGHAEGESEAADIVCTTERTFKLAAARLQLPPYAAHGTGCTFSAALTAALAQGQNDLQALFSAKAFVLGSLAEARSIGKTGMDVYGMFPPSHPEKYQKQILIGNL